MELVFLIMGTFRIRKVQQRVDDIPQRCIDHNVTEVTCGNVVENDALLPHPDDCQLFYYCVSPGHAPVCRQCPAGLHFSPTEHVCDEPGHAGCTSESIRIVN